MWEHQVCEDPGRGNRVCLAFVVLHHTPVNLRRMQQTGFSVMKGQAQDQEVESALTINYQTTL